MEPDEGIVLANGESISLTYDLTMGTAAGETEKTYVLWNKSGISTVKGPAITPRTGISAASFGSTSKSWTISMKPVWPYGTVVQQTVTGQRYMIVAASDDPLWAFDVIDLQTGLHDMIGQRGFEVVE